jgi:hypothetical protein
MPFFLGELNMSTEQVLITLPKAFSVRDEHELLAFQHLMARLNPSLRVTEVAQGLHREGGTTKFWGLVHTDLPSKETVLEALLEAGFDSDHNGAVIQHG